MPDTPETKHCPGCDTDKPVSDYYIVRRTGRPMTYCKACAKERADQWRRDNHAYSQSPRARQARDAAAGKAPAPPALTASVGADVPRALADALRADADARGVSMSEIIRGLLQDRYGGAEGREAA